MQRSNPSSPGGNDRLVTRDTETWQNYLGMRESNGKTSSKGNTEESGEIRWPGSI